jgi:hypothetical protein
VGQGQRHLHAQGELVEGQPGGLLRRLPLGLGEEDGERARAAPLEPNSVWNTRSSNCWVRSSCWRGWLDFAGGGVGLGLLPELGGLATVSVLAVVVPAPPMSWTVTAKVKPAAGAA